MLTWVYELLPAQNITSAMFFCMPQLYRVTLSSAQCDMTAFHSAEAPVACAILPFHCFPRVFFVSEFLFERLMLKLTLHNEGLPS